MLYRFRSRWRSPERSLRSPPAFFSSCAERLTPGIFQRSARRASIQRLAKGVLLLGLGLAATTASANTATIFNANYRADLNRIIVSGNLGTADTSVMVTSDFNGSTIGSKTVGTDGSWRVVLNNPVSVPCAVRASNGSDSDIALVTNAPADCDISATRNTAMIRTATFQASKNRIVVWGELADVGATVAVTREADNALLGTAVMKNNGTWKLILNSPASIPCAVTATEGNSQDSFQVRNAPADCVMPAPIVDTGPEIDNRAPVDSAVLVAEGKALFFNETFGGNGRTCGTCHREDNNFTIDPAYIATLPAEDPLFVAETNPALAQLEDPQLMRDYGLVRANVDGLEDPTNKFVMRSVSHILGLGSTLQTNAITPPFEMTGWSGDGAPGDGTLRDFSTGAVIQHFTRSLNRVEGTDFRLPTAGELDALEAYMLSVGTPATMDLAALQLSDPAAEAGRLNFLAEDSMGGTVRAAKCNSCHGNAGALTSAAGMNENFNTGVEDEPHAAVLAGGNLPIDGGFGTQFASTSGGFGNGQFNPPPLVYAADTAPYFHNNVAATLEEAIDHYASDHFKMSPEGMRLQIADSAGAEMTVDTDNLAAFLRVINSLENIRQAQLELSQARDYQTAAGIEGALAQASHELNDVVEVLNEGSLHEELVPDVETALAAISDARALATSQDAERDALIDSAVSTVYSVRDAMAVVLPYLDTTPPSVTVVDPGNGASVNGTIVLSATASDDTGVSSVSFEVAGLDLGDDATPPYQVSFDTTQIPDATYYVTVHATDLSHNTTKDYTRFVIDNSSVYVPPDEIAPTVSIVSPGDGSTAIGIVPVSVDAADDTAVALVLLSVDGVEVAQSITAPYQFDLDTTVFNDGSRILTATAQDAAGNNASHSIALNVDNLPPCTVYSCPVPPQPPSDPPPDQTMPSSASPDGEFDGEVIDVNLDDSTVAILTADGTKILRVTTSTEFMGSIAASLFEVLIGHTAQGEFFQSTSELVWIEAELPPGL